MPVVVIAVLLLATICVERTMQKSANQPLVFKEIRWYDLTPKEWRTDMVALVKTEFCFPCSLASGLG